MTLISVILVLVAERIGVHSKYWQASYYTSAFYAKLAEWGWLTPSSSRFRYAAVVIIPSIIILILVNAIDSGFFRLIVNTAVLMVCVGCPAIRAAYKCYLQAANRGDKQACSMYATEIDKDIEDINTFGLNLVWLNYQHYAAIILWFVFLGPAGSVMYVLARTGLEQTKAAQEEQSDLQYSAGRLMYILDWIPVRITALGLMLVGHFSNAMPIWLEHVADLNISAKILLINVTKAAEDIELEEDDCTEAPCTLVRLAKRNVMFLVVVISLLSISGLIR